MITREIEAAVRELNPASGWVTVFVPHTTAAVMINENADPDVCRDLEKVFDSLIPWRAGYAHAEGNTAAHAKAVLVGSSVRVPVSGGGVRLGVWQGVFFCEFDGPRERRVWVKEG